MTVKDELINQLNQIRNEINKYDNNPKNIVIYGAGNTSSLYQESLRLNNINPCVYVDNNPKKQKELFYGKKVISQEMINNIENPLILICSQNITFTNEIKHDLEKLSYHVLTVDEFIFAKNIDKILKVINLLNDEKSVHVYCSMILNRMNNTLPNDDIIEDNQYYAISEFKRISANEVFIDMGAFVGEGIEKHLFHRNGTFNKIIAFEPDIKNYNAMCCRVERLIKEWAIPENKIECVCAGVGDKTQSLEFISDKGVGSKFISDNNISNISGDIDKVSVYSIDDYIGDNQVMFLKADIESYELNMLHGAVNTIIKNKPKIAVCIYHGPSDMYEIPEFIDSLNLGYKFSVRQHSAELDDTVLYAYVDNQ